VSSPEIIDDHVYLHLRNQRFTCIDLRTGERKWTTKPYGKYWILVANGNRILALDQKGDLRLIRATPEEFDLLDERNISSDPAWAHLAICGNELFVREMKAIAAYRWKRTK
jgi:outer membrane protein assembly factor BamB